MSDTLVLKEAEFNRNLKLVEQRFLYGRGKGEEREMLNVKQEHEILLAELNQKLFEISEENSYLQQKVVKLEQVNKEVRLAKDPKEELKKMQQTILYLESQLKTYQSKDSTSQKNDSSKMKEQLPLEE